jgi:hypothetical protein
MIAFAEGPPRLLGRLRGGEDYLRGSAVQTRGDPGGFLPRKLDGQAADHRANRRAKLGPDDGL